MKFSFKKILLYLFVAIIITLPYISTKPIVWVAEEHTIEVQEAPTYDLNTKEGINYRLDELCAEYGQNPVLIKKIIACESNYNLTALNTKAVVGEDVGLFQINTYYHKEQATKLGYDIYNPEDNLLYGFELLKDQGTTPWNWSAHCWQK